MRKGYVHALEGIIAALIVVFYLTSIVSVPEPTDWTRTRISKQSEDLMSALDRSGFLDEAIMRDDRASFSAMVNALDSSLTYTIELAGLPRPQVTVAVLANNTSTYVDTTSGGDHGGTGFPVSYSPRRQGDLDTLAGGEPDHFGQVEYVLSDTVDNNETTYTRVNFDFDGDGSFNDPGEGPFALHDRFTCGAGVTGCDGHVYEVGPFNTTFRLYNAEYADTLAAAQPNLSIGRRDVAFTYEAANPSLESLDRYQAGIAKGWTVGTLSNYETPIDAFLEAGNFLLVQSQVTRSAIDGNYLGTLGFDYIDQYEVQGSGSTENVLYTVHGAENISYRTSTYYLDAPLTVRGFTDTGTRYETTFELQGVTVTARVPYSTDSVSFSADSYVTDYAVGDQVVLQDSTYVVDGIRPLELDPLDQQRFDSFETERVDADYHLTRMDGRSYNISAYDVSASTSDSTSDSNDPRLDGVVTTPCDTNTYPYRFGTVNVDGSDYRFLMINFEPEAPCTSYYEYVYFNFTADTDFNDNLPGQTPSGFSGEGPYQIDDTVQIDGFNYTVEPHTDGQGIDLRRQGPRLVGEIPVVQGAVDGRGSAALIRRQDMSDNDFHLLGVLLAAETQSRYAFTPPRSLGDVSFGYTYTSTAGEENPLAYTLDTIWWFS